MIWEPWAHMGHARWGLSKYVMWHGDKMHEMSSYTKMLSQFLLSATSVSHMAPNILGV